MTRRRRRKCRHCGQLFRPDPRNVRHQRYCSTEVCRRASKAASQRGEEEGLSEEEISFYDALAQNESAVEVMGNDQHRVIAHELLTNLKGNASVDWQHRASARARMRVLVKRILRKYGYPHSCSDNDGIDEETRT